MRWYMYPLVPFTLLNVLVSLILAIVYRPRSIHFSEGCIELVAGTKPNGQTRIFGRPGGQSLGCNVIWYASDAARCDKGLRVHERVHVRHGLIGLGIPFALAYVLHFLYHWARDRGHWHQSYLKIWSEKIAYREQREYMHGRRPDAWGSQEVKKP